LLAKRLINNSFSDFEQKNVSGFGQILIFCMLKLRQIQLPAAHNAEITIEENIQQPKPIFLWIP